MGLILHLTDLHLGGSDATPLGDYEKTPVLTAEQQEQRLDVYGSSLKALGELLTTRGDALSAIAITGDVCLRGDSAAYDVLPGLLTRLGAQLPAPDHILVVPGNHDVPWGTPPSTADRWGTFVNKIRRELGYVTPLIEGIDIDESGALINDPPLPIVTAEDGSFVLVGMNSADLCGSRRASDFADDALENLRSGDPVVEALLDEHERFRIADIARVSKQQLVAVGEVLRQLGEPKLPLRILALHHQLLPVTDAEEVKDFETIVNLAQVRRLIGTRAVSVVLHGHKHAPATYVDHVPLSPGPGVSDRSRRVLVSSGASLDEHWGEGTEYARLVDVIPGGESAANVRVLALPAVSLGAAFDEKVRFDLCGDVHLTTDPVELGVHVFEGETVDDVYDQLLLLHGPDGEALRVDTVVCRIAHGETAKRMPKNYQYPPEAAAGPQAWFDEIIEWWQTPDPRAPKPHFNHGERIFRLGGDHDQLAEVITALSTEPRTTRGIIEIIDPVQDEVWNTKHRMPAFCLVHLYFDNVDGNRLNCAAFFRKQSLKGWWPFNVAEMAHIQERVLNGLRESVPDAVPGEITTYSSVTVYGTARPRVIVPALDRDAAHAPEKISTVALGLFRPPPDGNALVAFDQYFQDWLPPDLMEPDGVPVALPGLELLSRVIAGFSTNFDRPKGQALSTEIHQAYLANLSYSRTEDEPRDMDNRQVEFNVWREQILHRHTVIMQLAEELIAEALDGHDSRAPD